MFKRPEGESLWLSVFQKKELTQRATEDHRVAQRNKKKLIGYTFLRNAFGILSIRF